MIALTGITKSFPGVKSLDGGQILANSNTLITREGYPIRSFYVYEADGYYQSQEEIDNAAVVYGDRTKLRPGYLKYKNNCDDDVIDDKDKIVVGNTIPEVGKAVQDAVKNAVESMTGLEIAAVNVNVGGITFPAAAKA